MLKAFKRNKILVGPKEFSELIANLAKAKKMFVF